jgi:hypothetical protein
MDRTHFAFERHREMLVGGDDTYAVQVTGSAVDVRPDRGTAERAIPLVLDTMEVSRGTSSLIADRTSYERQPDGTLAARIAANITESLENTKVGLEQSWIFNTTPAGTGDLEVALAVAGEPHVAQTATGLHFADPVTGIGVAYSNGTWIDSAGHKTTVIAQFDDSVIHLRVPGSVLESSTCPCVLDPTISAETAVDAPIRSTAPDVQRAPDISHPTVPAVGGEFIVVWQDRRRSFDMTYDIYSTAVSRTGVVGSPVGVPITDDSEYGDQISPKIVERAVVYASTGNSQYQYQYQIMFRAISGGFTGNGPLTPISAPASLHDDFSPAIAIIHPQDPRSAFAIAWRDVDRSSGNGQIFAAMIDPDGNVLPQVPLSSGAPNVNANAPVIASQPQQLIPEPVFRVAWSDNSHLPSVNNIEVADLTYFGGVFAPGAPVDISQSPTNADHPAIANFGGNAEPYDGFVIAYDVFNPTTSSFDITAKYYSAAGNALFGATLALPGTQTHPALAPNNATHDQMLLAWTDGYYADAPIRASRVALSGTTPTFSDASALLGVNASAAADTSVAISSDINYFLVWADTRPDSDIYGANLAFDAAGGTIAPPYLISQAGNRQTSPVSASCDGVYLVVWRDTRDAIVGGVYGSIFDATGHVISAGFKIATQSGPLTAAPAVVCDRQERTFFVAWQTDAKEIYGTGVKSDGSVIHVNGVPLVANGEKGSYPALADGGYGNLWLTYNGIGVNAIQLDVIGHRTAGPITVASDGTNADIAFDDSTAHFFVVWEWMQPSLKTADIMGASMTKDGVMGPILGIEQNPANQRFPRVSFDATSGLGTVVYEDDRNAVTKGVDVYGRLTTIFNPQGFSIQIASTTANERAPRLVRTGQGVFDVVYGSSPQADYFESDVYGQTVKSGALAGSAYAISSNANVREMTPTIACVKSICLSGYSALDPADGVSGVDRIQTRLLTY